MKIIDVKTVLLTGPCTNDPFLLEIRKRRSAAIVEIITDSGYIGLGETYAGYFCPEAVPAIVDFFRPILVGQSPEDIEILSERMVTCAAFWSRVGLGANIITALEAALWDLNGKIQGKPVCDLLGDAQHERLPCYATGGPSNYPLTKLKSKVDHYMSLGFNAVKVGSGEFYPDGKSRHSTDANEAADIEAKKLDYLRESYGSNLQLILDGHMHFRSSKDQWSLETAQTVLRACEPYNLLFFEEPLPYNDAQPYAELCESTKIAVAGGECLTTVDEWQTYIRADAFDIGQPDASFNGGLAQSYKIAQLLDERGRKIATHAWGAGASLMQNVHLAFACSNIEIIEIAPDYGPLHSEMIGDSLVIEDGYVKRPTTPGLGISLTDATKDRFPFVAGSGEFVSVPGKILVD